jgi:hypothetical protein
LGKTTYLTFHKNENVCEKWQNFVFFREHFRENLLRKMAKKIGQGHKLPGKLVKHFFENVTCFHEIYQYGYHKIRLGA